MTKMHKPTTLQLYLLTCSKF